MLEPGRSRAQISESAPQLQVVASGPSATGLADAGNEAEFCSAWLSMQCTRVSGIVGGLLMMPPPAAGVSVTSTSWPARNPYLEYLLRVAEHFSDGKIGALQGRILAINGGENMLTRFVAQEETIRYEGLMRGKEELGLFVPINGSCYFVRRDVLESVGGWDVSALSEDMDLAARIVNKGHKIMYASDVKSWQEYPSKLGDFFRQLF